MRLTTPAATLLSLALIVSVSAQPIPAPPPTQTFTDPAAAARQQPFALSENETRPELKRVAADIALALTTWEIGDGVADIAARLPPAAGAIADAFYRPGSWSRGRIVYPQLGGLLPDAASVMVVIEQTLGTAEGASTTVRTLDLRLHRVDGGWRLAQLASTGGDEAFPPADLPAIAAAVLADPRIELPDSARWDIHAGRISPVLLEVMARLAAETVLLRHQNESLKGQLDAATASMAKYWVTDIQGETIDEMLQLHGGYGYMTEYPIAQLYKDARVQRIYGGTNEIMKLLIARTL